MIRYICTNCREVFDLVAEAKGLDCCPNCLGDLLVTNQIKKKYDKADFRFTPEERKEIFDDWGKHIKSYPTQEQLSARNRVKNYRKKKLQKTG